MEVGSGDGGLNAQRRGYSGTNSYTSEEIHFPPFIMNADECNKIIGVKE